MARRRWLTNIAADGGSCTTFGMRLRRNGSSDKKQEADTSELNKCDGEPESDGVDVLEWGRAHALYAV